MPTIPATSSSTAAASNLDQVSILPQKALNQQDFLKLLVAQLSAQDPMNPVSNSDFLAQMAQFSTLQQTQSMQSDLAAIGARQAALQANSLLGRTVQVQPVTGEPVTGVVSAISLQAGTPTLTVNGQTYDLSQVLSVSVAPTTTNN